MISGPCVARSLSRVQCDELIAHIDTEREVSHHKYEQQTRTSLMLKRLIRYTSPIAKTTVLTELGREVVCAVLADWAEALAQPRVNDMMVRRLVLEDLNGKTIAHIDG